MNNSPILVTGGSGFIAGHTILQLLEQGHAVRATLRSQSKEPATRRALEAAGMVQGDRLQFVSADLMSDAGWADAMRGIDHVLHIASPVMPGHVDDEDDVIRPAREGTLRVLRAARDAGVRRVVLTSAFHAVSWGHSHDDHVFTEADWTKVDGPGVDAYGKAKTLAERAAWDFMATEGGAMELATMLPVAVMGRAIGADVSGSNHIIQMMLDGAMPGLPNLFIPIIDVRDVASAHVLAISHPDAAGQRLLLSSGPALSMKEIADTIRGDLGDAAAKVPTRSVPDLALRVMGLFNPQVRSIVPDLGYRKQMSNARARRLLDWTPRDPHEAIITAAASLAGRSAVAA